MTTEQVETTETVTKTVEITLCDKCGLEADGPIPLYQELRRETHVNSAEETMAYASRLILSNDPMCGAYVFRLPPGEARAVEVRPEPMVELCEDCYDEVFGWGD